MIGDELVEANKAERMATRKKPSSTARPARGPPESLDSLGRYEEKRDFATTPEPAPERDVPSEISARSAFVIQRHDARRLHYDLRLQVGDAMMSFAVPKGPSYDPKVKRFAIEVEDHPISYNEFEGTIPKGEYGGGEVVIWDRGTFAPLPSKDLPGVTTIEEMRAAGQIKVRLFGDKLLGEWHLVRTGDKVGEGASWLFFKKQDRFADPKRDVVEERPESVVSVPATQGPRAILAMIGDVARATAPREGANLPDPARWWLEIKYDGYRLLGIKSGNDVRLFSRAHHDWTDKFTLLADAIGKLSPSTLVLDGEACAVDEAGNPAFHRLQQWLSGERRTAALVFAAFDLLHVDGEDLRALPFETRRARLTQLLADAPKPLTISTALEGDPKSLLAAIRASGLEGLIAKRKGSAYASGPTTDWIKLKVEKRQDFAVIGWTPLTGHRNAVGALILGVYDGGVLRFAGKVGSGFDDALRRELGKTLVTDHVASCVARDPERIPDARWVQPRLVVEVAYQDWTESGKPRFPTLIAMRPDKKPIECLIEPHPHANFRTDREDRDEREPDAAERPAASVRAGPKPTLTNPDKVLFPRDRLTKRDVWDYAAVIAPAMLPHVRGRPINVQRWPNGIDRPSWFQHRPPEKSPEFVRLITADDKVRILVENVETLQWLTQLAALTLHQWASHAPPEGADAAQIAASLAQPDYFVIDLDPGTGTWADLVQIARAVRTLLDALELVSVVKTSGKRGVHVVVPLAPGQTHALATGFAEQVGRAVAKVLPHIATVERTVEKRGGRLYVDFGQNGAGRTVVSPYTVRAVDGATVSCPIRWDELDEKLDPRAFTIRTVPERVAKMGDLFAEVLNGTAMLKKYEK